MYENEISLRKSGDAVQLRPLEQGFSTFSSRWPNS